MEPSYRWKLVRRASGRDGSSLLARERESSPPGAPQPTEAGGAIGNSPVHPLNRKRVPLPYILWGMGLGRR